MCVRRHRDGWVRGEGGAHGHDLGDVAHAALPGHLLHAVRDEVDDRPPLVLVRPVRR